MSWSEAKRQTRIKKLKRRDGALCWLCGEKFTQERRPTIDHAIPKARGGGNGIENLRLAHLDCNQRRGCIESAPDRAARVRLASVKITFPRTDKASVEETRDAA